MQYRNIPQFISGIGPFDIYLGKNIICNLIPKQHIKHISGSKKHSVLQKLHVTLSVWGGELPDDENGSHPITVSYFMLHIVKLKQRKKKEKCSMCIEIAY